MANPILFSGQNRRISTATGLKTSIFHAKSICTILSITIQLTADATVQLLDATGYPISAPFNLVGGVIWSPPGRLLTNDERIYLSISGATTANYEIVWESGNCVEKIRDHRNNFYIPDALVDGSSTTASAPAQTVVTAVDAQILAANAARKEMMVQNTGTSIVYLTLGAVSTATAYHVALPACAAANDGTGGVYISDWWRGTVHAIASGAGDVVITELS